MDQDTSCAQFQEQATVNSKEVKRDKECWTAFLNRKEQKKNAIEKYIDGKYRRISSKFTINI